MSKEGTLIGIVALAVVLSLLWTSVLRHPDRSGGTESANPVTAVPPGMAEPSARALSKTGGDDEAADNEDPDTVEDRLQETIAMQSAAQLGETLERSFQTQAAFALNAARNNLLQRGKAGDLESLQVLALLLPKQNLQLAKLAAQILAEVATPDSLKLLIDACSGAPPGDRRAMLLNAIREVGDWRDDAAAPELMTQLLENYLHSLAPADSLGYEAIGFALAGIGTPSGIAQLVELLKSMQPGSPQTRGSRRALAAALQEVRNPLAVPILARELNASGPRTDVAGIAGEALAAAGLPEATQALLDWAAQVRTRYQTEQAVEWLSKVRDPQSLKMLLNVAARNDFQDPDLQQRLAALARQMAAKLS